MIDDYESHIAFRGIIVGVALSTILWGIMFALWYWIFG